MNAPTAPGIEPVQTIKTGKPGRPKYSEEQFRVWLDDLRPYLENSSSLYYACKKSGLIERYYAILEKYNLNDWFSQKVDTYRAEPGEIANDVYVRLIRGIAKRTKQDDTLSDNDIRILESFAKTHRTAQPFFVNRTETATADPKKVGKILDNLEATNYDDVGSEAQKQMVETKQPVQDQGQKGPAGDVPTELPTTQTPSGTPQP